MAGNEREADLGWRPDCWLLFGKVPTDWISQVIKVTGNMSKDVAEGYET